MERIDTKKSTLTGYVRRSTKKHRNSVIILKSLVF